MKLFVPEEETIQLGRAIKDSEKLLVSEIAWVETTSALARMHKGNRISSDDLDNKISALSRFWVGLYKVNVSWALLVEAADLALKYRLKAYDSIQLAAVSRAAASSDLSLLCWNEEILRAAKDEGIVCFA